MIQNKQKIIGITGGISTGKSTVTKILTDKNFTVIDADLIAREVLNIGKDAYKELISCFGEEILKPDKSVDRSALGEKIFKSKDLRDRLNSITHPHVMKDIKKSMDEFRDKEVIFLDIPLLIEVYDDLIKHKIIIDEIWLIYCNKETQIKRLMKRDGIGLEFAINKIEAQMDIEEKKKDADKIICNMKEKKDLIEILEYNLKQIS